MAHFAKLDENNNVLQVVVIHNNELLDSNGIEQETMGINFLTKLFGYPLWKQVSYNGSFRKNYAGIGYTYDPKLDMFIMPKPYTSWTLNTATGAWEAPIKKPEDGKLYLWLEELQQWVEDVYSGKH